MRDFKIICLGALILALFFWVVGEPTDGSWYSEHLIVFFASKIIALVVMYCAGSEIGELFNQK